MRQSITPIFRALAFLAIGFANTVAAAPFSQGMVNAG